MGGPFYNKVIHIPDLQFTKFCEDNYSINRGLYNVIDSWFYNNGHHNLLNRRRKIIHFLTYVNSCKKENSKVKFGKGGLIQTLEEFQKSDLMEKVDD